MENKKTYHVQNSEKCYRFKPDAFYSHAPDRLGIYELVTFDSAGNPTVLFVGAAFDATIQACLIAHAEGTRAPAASELLQSHGNLYFDYIERMDAVSKEDAQDIVAWLVEKHRPAYNVAPVSSSGRYAAVDVIEA